METNRLRQFQVVAQTRNLRKAAELLNLSHSALSKSLKVLQEQINKGLLVQKGRNIELTEEGLSFLPKITDFLAREEALLAPDEIRVETMRLGTFEVFSTHLLGRVWSEYFPEAQLELREFLPGSLEASIKNRIVDFGITYEPIPTAGVEFISIGSVEMKIYGLEGRFADIEFSRLPFVTPVSPILGTPTGVKGLDGWPDDKFPRFAKFRVDMMESGLSLARMGSAVIFAPEFVIRHHNESVLKRAQLFEKPLPKGMKKVLRKVYLLTRDGATESKEFRKLASIMRNECA